MQASVTVIHGSPAFSRASATPHTHQTVLSSRHSYTSATCSPAVLAVHPGRATSFGRCSARLVVKAARTPANQGRNSEVDDILKKYAQPKAQPGPPPAPPAKVGSAVLATNTGTGLFLILLLNIGVFVADHIFHLPIAHTLYLNHLHPRWWQFITCAFCHADWQHLSSNIFMLYVFGKIVEEEEGGFGVWMTYLVTAFGASVASYLMLALNAVSLGASGAVFGLFAVSVLCKLQFNFKKLLECAILGQFVVKQVMQEAQSQAAVGAGGAIIAGTQVSHIAHLAGAMVGVVLVYALTRLPALDDGSQRQQ